MADRHDPRATWTLRPRGELLLQHSPTEIQLNATTRPHWLLSAAYLHWQGHGVRWALRCIIARSRVVRSTLGHQRRILRAPPSRRDHPCCTVARPRIEATHHVVDSKRGAQRLAALRMQLCESPCKQLVDWSALHLFMPATCTRASVRSALSLLVRANGGEAAAHLEHDG